MQLAELSEDQAATVISVLGAVATARGTQAASAPDRAVIRAAARHLLGGPDVPRELAWSIPGDVAEQLSAPETCDLTLTVATILGATDPAAIDDEPRGVLDPDRAVVVDDLARYLGVHERDVLELRRRTKRLRDHVAFDLNRRYLIGTTGDETTMIHAAVLQAETRLDIDARRVHSLWDRIERLPDGTVGAELVRYYRENGWRYPGTNHHQPLSFAEHDLHHVLGGYATTPAGELQVGAFTAGVADRPMDGVRLFLLREQLGTGSPTIPDVLAAFDSERFLVALARGSCTTRDFVGRSWDPWSIVDRDITEIRAQLRIGPGAQLGPSDPYNLDPYNLDPAALGV